jgi:hypothetical protein
LTERRADEIPLLLGPACTDKRNTPPGESTGAKKFKRRVAFMRKLVSLKQLIEEEGVDVETTYVDPDDLAEVEEETDEED